MVLEFVNRLGRYRFWFYTFVAFTFRIINPRTRNEWPFCFWFLFVQIVYVYDISRFFEVPAKCLDGVRTSQIILF